MVAQPSIELDTISPSPLTASTTFTSFASHEERGQSPPRGRDESPASLRMRGMGIGQEEDAEGVALEPVDHGKGAWGFVAAAFILETFVWGYSYSFATVLVFLQQDPAWSENSIASLSAIGSVQLGVQFLMPIFAVLTFRRYPEYVRRILAGCAAVNCLSMLASSWATEVWQLILLQGVLGGATASWLYSPVLIFLNDWFVLRKGLASGIIFAGAGIGGFVFPFLIQGLLDKVGFHGMLRVWSGITAVAFAVAVYLIRPRIPPPKKVNRGERGPWIPVSPKVLLHPLLISMCVASLFCSLATFPASLYLGTYAAALTSSTRQTEIVVGVYNGASALGCAATGYLADRHWPFASTLCELLSAVIALTAWGFASSIPAVFGFACAAGFVSQIIAAWGSCVTDVANGNPNVANLAFGVLSIVRGAASVSMPFVSAGLYQKSVSGSGDGGKWGKFGFEKMIVFVGVMGALSAIASVVTGFIRRKMVLEGKLK